MLREKITAYQAEDIIRRGDQVRAAFIKSFYGLQWDAANAFDLLIDTGKIPPHLAVNWIINADDALRKKDLFNDPNISSLDVDPILVTVIYNELAKTTDT